MFTYGLSWSPDGDKILYSSPNWEDLWLLDLTTDQVRRLGLVGGSDSIMGGSFGPDLDANTIGYQGIITYYMTDLTSDDWGDIHVVEVSTATTKHSCRIS